MQAEDTPFRFIDLLNEADRRRLAQTSAPRAFGAGAMIIAEDDPPGEMYLMISGHGQVCVYSADGRDVSYRDLIPGDIFGELSMIDGLPRSAFVTARTDVVVVAIDSAAYGRLIATHPAIGLAMSRHLSAQIRILTTRVLEVTTLLVRDRLLRELSRRAQRTGPDGDVGEVRPAPTHADLASRIGTHREAVTKELSRLAREGHIVRADGALLIPSLRALPD